MRNGLILIAAATMGLSACDTSQIGKDFMREAGSSLDRGEFGNSSLYNQLVHTGELNAAINLTRKFAAEAPNTINFDFDQSNLDAEARAALVKQADWIKQYPYVKFRVYGHTDKVGSNAYNQSLGLRRARAAVNFLVSQGISRSRLEAVSSFGETQPLVMTEGRERRNRRTVTEVSGFLKGRPQILDGKYAEQNYNNYIGGAEEAAPGATADSTADQ